MEIAAIFDMDGVIVNNSKYHQKAWEEFSRRYDIPFSEEKFKHKFFGRTNKQVMPELFDRDLSDDEIKALDNEKEQIYRDIYRPHLKPVAGLIDFLEELQSHKIPVAVATSAPRQNVDFIFDGLGIEKYIDKVVTDAMVSEGKPHPEIYQKAAEMLGKKPEECVVFEDSKSGTKAAWDAGAKVIAITTTLPAEKHEHAHKTVPDFTSVSVELIRDLFS